MREGTRVRFERVLSGLEAGLSRGEAARLGGWDWERVRRLVRREGLGDRVGVALEVGRVSRGVGGRPVEGLGFEEFRRLVFRHGTFEHQREWVDWAGDEDAHHVLIVTCPDAAKTTLFREWLIFRLAQDPLLRVGYATFSLRVAQKQVDLMRRVFEENSMLRRLAGDLVPKDVKRTWAADRFMLAPRSFDVGMEEADYSVVAFGAGSQVANARLDLLLIDDIDAKRDLSLSERYEIYEKIQTDFESRLGVGDRMIVVCNRWDEKDVAGLIMAHARETPGLWRVYESPAVREWPSDSKPYGSVIWPERFGTTSGKIGDYWSEQKAWEYFKRKRAQIGARRFSLMYQNKPGGDEQRDFPAELVNLAVHRGKDTSFGRPPLGSIIVAALDPAETEGAGVIALAVTADQIQVVNCEWGTQRRETGLHAWLEEYGRLRPAYWAIEAQGPWKIWTTSLLVKDIVRRQGAQLVPLMTGENKRRDDIGISSLVPIVRDQLVIPSRTEADQDRMRPLVDQLVGYRPPRWENNRYIYSNEPYDLLMALWLGIRVVRDKRLQERFQPLPAPAARGWGSPYKSTWDASHTWRSVR